MYIRWSGYGIFAPFIIGLAAVAGKAVVRDLYGPTYVAVHPWGLWLGLALGGLICFWVGSSGRHTLYWIPMKWWGVGALVVGLLFAVVGNAIPTQFYPRSGSNGVASVRAPMANAISRQSFDSSVNASQQTAMRLYPALAVAGSDFNTRFLALHKRYSAEQPAYFSDPNWPLTLAREVAAGAR